MRGDTLCRRERVSERSRCGEWMSESGYVMARIGSSPGSADVPHAPFPL